MHSTVSILPCIHAQHAYTVHYLHTISACKVVVIACHVAENVCDDCDEYSKDGVDYIVTTPSPVQFSGVVM